MEKIIIVTKKWGRNFSGATLATQCLAAQWIKKAISIHVITLMCGDCLDLSGVSVSICRNKEEIKKTVLRAWNENKNSTVFYSDDHLGYILAGLGIPYFHTYHGNWPDARYIDAQFFVKSFYFIPLYKKTLRGACNVINVSHYMEKFTLKYNVRSEVVHNGIDYKMELESILHPKTFVMVGGIDKRKYKYAVKIAERLNIIAPEVKIHIYGKCIDQSVAKQLNIQQNIVLMGQQDAIPYKSYVGLINASSMENLSISVCEAILNKIPVFCFNVGGLPEVVVEEKTGYVIKKFDVEMMAETVAAYVKNQNMNVDVSKLFDFNWEYAADKYLELFNKEAEKKNENLCFGTCCDR